MKSPKPSAIQCPCESGKPYQACCRPYHQGVAAPTAEELMRSRYTAYVMELEDYLLKTWHTDTRPQALNLSEDTAIKWLGLQVTNTMLTGDDSATVTFVARYKICGKAEKIHEISKFLRIENAWYYLSGVHIN